MLLHIWVNRSLAICEADGSHRHLGHCQAVGWSACGQYIHCLQATKRTEPSSQLNHDCACHVWYASNLQRLYIWQRPDGSHAASPRQSIVWAHDAPVCYIPDQQMVVVMPDFSFQSSSARENAMVTGCGSAFESPLSSLGMVMTANWQRQCLQSTELPDACLLHSAQPLQSSSGGVVLAARFRPTWDVHGARRERGYIVPDTWYTGKHHKTMTWYPTHCNSRMYAACTWGHSTGGDVCLMDGRALKVAVTWPRCQLEPADMPPDSGAVGLEWSPDGERLIMTWRACIRFLLFGDQK